MIGALQTRDPKDDYLFALALATKADAVVSGDRDLLDDQQKDIAVWTPRALANQVD